jgi:lysozyme
MTPIANKTLPDNIKRMLMLITFTEGTDLHGKPYNTLFTHKTFEGYQKHPNIVVQSGKLRSTAAGRYQILYKTYLDLGGGLFTPEAQDTLCTKLLKRRKAYDDALTGNWRDAIQKCNKEWASLPGSPYGQPTHKLEDCLNFLNTVHV